MRSRFVRFLPLLVLAVPVTAWAAAPNAAVSQQASTASAHAGMALGAKDLKMTQMHLHHVINCLVGPSGKAFDAAAGNPCKGMGDGAVGDAQGDAAAETKLRAALADAERGVQATSLDAAHADAQKALTTLQQK